jgi:hypothetical protein
VAEQKAEKMTFGSGSKITGILMIFSGLPAVMDPIDRSAQFVGAIIAIAGLILIIWSGLRPRKKKTR